MSRFGLNPFEFRAGIYWICAAVDGHPSDCLNPFEFRAGIYCVETLQAAQELAVLIPLNSGLVFTVQRKLSMEIVLPS